MLSGHPITFFLSLTPSMKAFSTVKKNKKGNQREKKTYKKIKLEKDRKKSKFFLFVMI